MGSTLRMPQKEAVKELGRSYREAGVLSRSGYKWLENLEDDDTQMHFDRHDSDGLTCKA